MSQVATRFHFDEAAAEIKIERVQDCAPMLDHAKSLAVADATGSSDVKHAAHLPAVLVEKYLNDHGITFREFVINPEHVKRMLRDPSLSGFRIWKGAI